MEQITERQVYEPKDDCSKLLMALFFLAPVVCFAADKVEGVIISRTSETLIVNGPDGKVTVVLADDARKQKTIRDFWV